VFNLQGGEIIIVMLLALVVLGPEKLPEAMRRAGKAYAEFKKMSTSFQQEFRSVLDEPMREMRDTANLLRDSADFRKLQDGERAEKPHSAQMAAAPDPDAIPTSDVPFQTDESGGSAAPAEPTPDPFGASLRFSAAPPSPVTTPTASPSTAASSTKDASQHTDLGDAIAAPAIAAPDEFGESLTFSAPSQASSERPPEEPPT
jgi:sec-independent protein translocase protein TatB